jgi:hypothetical protein
VAAGVTSLADAAVDEGRAATAMLLDTGVPELLIQVHGWLLPDMAVDRALLAVLASSLAAPLGPSRCSWTAACSFWISRLLTAAVGVDRAACCMQLQTPWLANVRCVWRWQGRTALRGLAQHHPAAVQRALDAVDVPFPPDTSPAAWQAWWADLRIDLQRAVAKRIAKRTFVL